MPTYPEQAIDDCSNCGNHKQGHFNLEPCRSCLDEVNLCFEENTLIYYMNWIPLKVQEDDINHPAHYHRGGIECIDYLKAKLTTEEFIGYLKGNCMKYLSRMGHKDAAVKEAGKAAWYANRLKKELSDTIS